MTSNSTPKLISNLSFLLKFNTNNKSMMRNSSLYKPKLFPQKSRKRNQKPKLNLKSDSTKSGKIELPMFWKKRTSINSPPNTTETWPSFSSGFFLNTSSQTLKNKFSLLKHKREYNKFCRKTVSA